MPWGCAGTLGGAKQRWAGRPDSQAEGSTANTAGTALHGSAKHSDPSWALLAAGQKMRPSQRELPTSPGQRKPLMVRRQGHEPEEPQGLRWGSEWSRESSKSRNHLPGGNGTPQASAVQTQLSHLLHPKGEMLGIAGRSPWHQHHPADQTMPAIQAARGKEEGK